jgi:Tfp pilus assembly protein PilV
MALIEVLLGFVLLAISGVAWIVLAGQTARSLRSVRDSELLTFNAVSTMEWVSVRSETELQAMTGRRRYGAFDITISTLLPGLYEVIVSDTLTRATILHSSVYASYAATDTIK